jgi:hypothetical protein
MDVASEILKCRELTSECDELTIDMNDNNPSSIEDILRLKYEIDDLISFAFSQIIEISKYRNIIEGNPVTDMKQSALKLFPSNTNSYQVGVLFLE